MPERSSICRIYQLTHKTHKMEQPKVAGTVPEMVELEAGKKYYWCSCGQSSNQPLCNGAHKGSAFSPQPFQVEEPKKAAICMCKQTKNPPYCDGSHRNL